MADSTNKSKENSEEQEKLEKQKKSSLELKDKFLLSLKEDYKSKKTSEKTIFLNKILKSNGNNLDGFKDTLENFKKQQSKISIVDNNELGDFDINKLKLSDLKNTFKEDLISIAIDRDLLKKQLLNDYELDENKYNSDILIEVEKININGFTDLKKSKKSRKEFLINVFGGINNLPLEKSKINIFENILELKGSFNKIKNNEDKQKLLDILQVLENRDKSLGLTSSVKSALVDLLELKFISDDIKIGLLKNFIPLISYGDIKNIGVSFDDNEIRNQIIDNIFSKEEIEDLGLELLKNNINLSDLSFETKYLSDPDILSIFNGGRDIKNSIIDNFSENFDLTLNKAKEEIKDKGPNTLVELSSELKNETNNLVIDEGKILKIVEKDEKGKEKISYIRIIKGDDKKRELTILNIGSNEHGEEKINLKIPTSNAIVILYFEFNNKLKEKNFNLLSYSEKDIKNKIIDSEDNLQSSDLILYNESNLEDDENKQKLTEDYHNSINNDILNLEKELEERSGKDSEIEKELEKEIKLKKIILSEVVSNETLLNFLNLRELLKKIDEIDINGKNIGLGKGVILETDKMTYEIIGVSNDKIILKGRGGKESLSFEDFFQAFKKNKPKRIKKVNDFGDLVDNFKIDNNKWDKYEFKDGNFKIKESDRGDSKSEKENVEYFTSEKNDKIVKIDSIGGDSIVLQFGERKGTNALEKKDKNYDKDGKGEVLYISGADKITLTLNEFQKYLKDNDLEPNWKTGKTIESKKPDDLNNYFHGGFLNRVFKRISIAELIAGGKIFIDNLTETMKKGNDVHAANVALALGKFLSEEVRADLKIKVEQAEAEEMEKAIKGLGDVDSPDAIKRIKGWILNKDTPEYKKEAGLMFVMKKYGTLTGKAGLYGFKGKFLWYEALGGRKNDELYLRIKEEAEKGNKSFTEELLVHRLLQGQCGGRISPHRRSRLHKDYENNWKTGMKEEAQKGYDDASNFRNAKDMVSGGNGELLNGNIPNAVGWYKKAIERGGSLEDMSEGFFLMVFSGALYTTHETIYTKYIKGLWDGDQMPMILARMSGDIKDMKLLNRVIVNLSKDIEDSNKGNLKYKGMHDTAQGIFNDAISGKGTEKDRVERSLEFWKKYGKELSRALNMNHIGDSSSSKTDKTIILKKDEDKLYGEYFDKVREYTPETFKEEFMNDASGLEGIAGLDTNEIIKKYFKLDRSGTIPSNKLPVVEKLWGKIGEDINSVKDKDFVGGDNEKRKYLKFILSDLLAGFVINHNPDAGLGNYATGALFKDNMQKWGIDTIFLEKMWKYSGDTILKGDNNECNEMLDKIIENILSGGVSTNDNTNYSSPFDDLLEETPKNANNILG